MLYICSHTFILGLVLTPSTNLFVAFCVHHSYVSRYHVKDSARHVILGTQQFKPNEFASQINLSMENAWGILRCVIDICRKLDEGKYLILKDPNKVSNYKAHTSLKCISFRLLLRDCFQLSFLSIPNAENLFEYTFRSFILILLKLGVKNMKQFHVFFRGSGMCCQQISSGTTYFHSRWQFH